MPPGGGLKRRPAFLRAIVPHAGDRSCAAWRPLPLAAAAAMPARRCLLSKSVCLVVPPWRAARIHAGTSRTPPTPASPTRRHPVGLAQDRRAEVHALEDSPFAPGSTISVEVGSGVGQAFSTAGK